MNTILKLIYYCYEVNLKCLEAKEKIVKNKKKLAFLKSAHQKFDEYALSRSKFSKEENESPYCNQNQIAVISL